MWNNARLMNLITNGMLILAGAIVVHIGFLLASSSPRFALSRASLHGSLDHVTSGQVTEAIAGRAIGNFFSADLLLVKQLVEEIQWVRNADVRRQWPDRLEILIEEHRDFLGPRIGRDVLSYAAEGEWTEEEVVASAGWSTRPRRCSGRTSRSISRPIS